MFALLFFPYAEGSTCPHPTHYFDKIISALSCQVNSYLNKKVSQNRIEKFSILYGFISWQLALS
jgi:hypothetical protein